MLIRKLTLGNEYELNFGFYRQTFHHESDWPDWGFGIHVSLGYDHVYGNIHGNFLYPDGMGCPPLDGNSIAWRDNLIELALPLNCLAEFTNAPVFLNHFDIHIFNNWPVEEVPYDDFCQDFIAEWDAEDFDPLYDEFWGYRLDLGNLSRSIQIACSILMGQVWAGPDLEGDFNNVVQAVRDAVTNASFFLGEGMPEVTWVVVEEVSMPFPDGRYGRLLEICAPMLAGKAMTMGQHHALGMPCKIGIWTEDSDWDGTDDHIKINTLNESALFAFFFADAMRMAPDLLAQFENMIKSQVKDMVGTAINNLGGQCFYQPQPPFFTEDDIQAIQFWADPNLGGGYAGDNGYGLSLEIPFAGNKDAQQSDPNFLSEVKNSIIAAIGNTPNVPDDPNDWHVINPNFNIPVADENNPDTFAFIGEIKLCSPYYAGQVVGLGGKYMIAMPCTVSVWLNDLTWDVSGLPVYQPPTKVIVSILNPEFILQHYFKDVDPSMAAPLAEMGTLIKTQVQSMVDYGLRGYTQ